MTVRKLLVFGGFAASAILIVFGVFAIVLGVEGRDTVRDGLKRENIVVNDIRVTDGQSAKDVADIMRGHVLEATGGKTYSELPRYLGQNGKPTADEKQARIDPQTGQPVENPLRSLWVQETALSTALNQGYFAENVANFGIVTGIALLLAGIGFLVLDLSALYLPTRRGP